MSAMQIRSPAMSASPSASAAPWPSSAEIARRRPNFDLVDAVATALGLDFRPIERHDPAQEGLRGVAVEADADARALAGQPAQLAGGRLRRLARGRRGLAGAVQGQLPVVLVAERRAAGALIEPARDMHVIEDDKADARQPQQPLGEEIDARRLEREQPPKMAKLVAPALENQPRRPPLDGEEVLRPIGAQPQRVGEKRSGAAGREIGCRCRPDAQRLVRRRHEIGDRERAVGARHDELGFGEMKSGIHAVARARIGPALAQRFLCGAGTAPGFRPGRRPMLTPRVGV
ncbi:MAG: hypothetical protein ACJ8C3_00950 [Microvirga sp.]